MTLAVTRALGPGAPRGEPALGIAVVVTLIVQTAGALMWAGAVDQRLAHLEAEVARLGALIERTARLETEVENVAHVLERIELHLAPSPEKVQGGP